MSSDPGLGVRPYHDEADLQELRRELLDPLALGVFVLVCILIAIASVDMALDRVKLWQVITPLLAAAGISRFRRLGEEVAAALTILALGASVVVASLVFPESQVVYSFSLVVIAASVLRGTLPAILAAGAASAAILGFGLTADSSGAGVPTIGVLFMVWSTAILCWLSGRPTRTALEWAWRSYLLALNRTEELRDQRGELGRLAKSLNETCIRLEEMNWELERARRSAEEARRLKTEFAAMISHELRTPLNMVIGFSEMMMGAPHAYAGQPLPSGYRQDVEAIYRNACQISRLISDVLDLSQIEAQRMALERDDSSLSQIVDEAVATLRPHFERLGLALRVAVPDDLPRLYVDANRIRQILINLLNNAARFTDHGGVTIDARLEEDNVVVAVADTGVGIAPEDLPYVFQDYRQVGPSNRRHGGSGLGLAICKRFAEMHGGFMWVESGVGQGSTFYLSLPLCDNVVSAPSSLGPAPRAATSRTVVVLDRDPEAARVFQRYLDSYRVVHAASAGQLSRLMSEAVPQAIVVGGPSALEQVESWWGQCPRDGRLRDLPVFTCEVSSQRALVEQLGVARYLVKPLHRDQLLATLRRVGKDIRDLLVVDDDPDMLSLIDRLIRSSSRRLRTRQAGDGVRALELLRERRPDLVLLDLQMPGMGGLEVLRQMREDPGLREVPVAIITAQEEPGEPFRARSLGLSRADGLMVGEMMRCLRSSLDALLEPGSPGIAPTQPTGPVA